MTEAEWNACCEPQTMLDFVGESGRATARKLRLFACACCRQVWHLMVDERSRGAVAAAEAVADRPARRAKQAAARAGAQEACRAAAYAHAHRTPAAPAARAAYHAATTSRHAVYHAAAGAAEAAMYAGQEIDPAEQAALLRDIIGNPFRPAALDPAWLTRDVVALAQAAYAHRDLPSGHLDPQRLAVLADALEDAGCEDAELLGHLRGEGPHWRGCWALDAVMGKS
jgi:hypothetical protein